MNVPVEELQHAIDVLKHLDPKPGRRYDSSRTIYVEPDVQVVKVDDDYVVLFNDDGLPRLRVSPFYRRLLALEQRRPRRRGSKLPAREDARRPVAHEEPRPAKEDDRPGRRVDRPQAARLPRLGRGAPQAADPQGCRRRHRDARVHRLARGLEQVDGDAAGPPADEVLLPFGDQLLGGEDVSSLAVKGKIRALVEAEDSAHPLSDARLSELLAREGIHIARRTVAKYREELHIPSSSIRKVERGPAGPPA